MCVRRCVFFLSAAVMTDYMYPTWNSSVGDNTKTPQEGTILPTPPLRTGPDSISSSSDKPIVYTSEA